MFVYQSTNYNTNETYSITGKNVIECCASILNYNNGYENNDSEKEYIVKFINDDGEIVAEITETSLQYAIVSDNDNATEKMKQESEKFWDMNHEKIMVIEFNNPIHNGDAEWDEDYESEYESDDEKYVSDDDTIEQNYNKTN